MLMEEEENKNARKPKRANKKWLAANYEQISFRAPKGTKEEIKAAAAACSISMAAYIRAAQRKSGKDDLKMNFFAG